MSHFQLSIQQTAKNGLNASFQLFSHETPQGWLQYNGNIVKDGTWNGECLGQKLFLEHKCRHDRSRRAFGVFCAHMPSGETGLLYSTYSGGIFSRIRYHQLELTRATYQLYCVPMGRDGLKFPVWNSDRQVALIEKPNVTRNELYQFQIDALSEELAFVSVLLTTSLYVRQYFSGNTTGVQSSQAEYRKTTNLQLLNKYDPSFITRIE